LKKKFIEKARILIEALPFIQEFYNKTIVIKYGGNAMEDPALKEKVMQDLVLLKFIGINIVLVHGGGPHITSLMEKLGKKPVFISGHRVTDLETMEITEMVLSGQINKEITAQINSNGAKAAGISGRDGGIILAGVKDKKLGQVGSIIKINPELLLTLIDKGYIPVVSPVAAGINGEAFNINADTAAGEIAINLKAFKLIYMTDIKGIYSDLKDENTFIPTINEQGIKKMIKNGLIDKGMLPKVESAIKSINNGVGKVHIIDGTIEHALILELLTSAGVGSEIIK
jgi:acetylglutamate kinase